MNPFVYDKPLPAGEMVGRDNERARLLEITTAGVNCLVASPRRYGKTTLLRQVLREAEDRGIPVAFVDLDGARTLQAVTEAIEAAYKPLKSWGARAKDGAHAAGLTVTAGLPGLSSGAKLQSDAATVKALRRVLEVPRRKQRKSGTPCLVVFDEFQNVLMVSAGAEGLDGLMRSVIQHHADIAAYVFAGSEPSLMAELFGSRERPLFGQARPVELPCLPDDALSDFIRGKFTATGRDVGGALSPLLRFVRGHPQRAVLMAHYVWEQTPTRGRASGSTWRRAQGTALAEHARFFSASWDRMGGSEQETLRAVAEGRPAATFVVDRMIAEGQLVRDRGELWFVDPLYRAWLLGGEHVAREVDKVTAELMVQLLGVPVNEWPESARGAVFDQAATLKNVTARGRLVPLSQGEMAVLDRARRLVVQEVSEGLGLSRAEVEDLIALAIA